MAEMPQAQAEALANHYASLLDDRLATKDEDIKQLESNDIKLLKSDIKQLASKVEKDNTQLASDIKQLASDNTQLASDMEQLASKVKQLDIKQAMLKKIMPNWQARLTKIMLNWQVMVNNWKAILNWRPEDPLDQDARCTICYDQSDYRRIGFLELTNSEYYSSLSPFELSLALKSL